MFISRFLKCEVKAEDEKKKKKKCQKEMKNKKGKMKRNKKNFWYSIKKKTKGKKKNEISFH